MDRLITLLCTMLLAGALAGGGVWAWDRHPPISIPVLFWHLKLPDSLQGERDAALAASRMAQDGQKRCDASLAVQNASLAQATEKGAKALTLAQTALDAAKARNARLLSAASSLKDFLAMAGETSCQRWDRADGEVLAALMMGK